MWVSQLAHVDLSDHDIRPMRNERSKAEAEAEAEATPKGSRPAKGSRHLRPTHDDLVTLAK